MRQTHQKKITVNMPEDLLITASKVTGKGITETLRLGLELLARQHAYQKLLELKGSHNFSLDINELRKDKDEK